MRTMYDSVNPRIIPADAAMVAGYVDGKYRWTEEGWGRFPHAVKVRIAVLPETDAGNVLDVERYDAAPGQAPGWVTMRRRAGVEPTVYCSRSAWPVVREAFRSSGVSEPQYWIADYTGKEHLPAGAVACQWGSAPTLDTSCVADYWPGVDPLPAEHTGALAPPPGTGVAAVPGFNGLLCCAYRDINRVWQPLTEPFLRQLVTDAVRTALAEKPPST